MTRPDVAPLAVSFGRPHQDNLAQQWLRRPAVRRWVSATVVMHEVRDRFVAGPTVVEALAQAVDFSDKGLESSFLPLLPVARTASEAARQVEVQHDLIDRIGQGGLPTADLSIQLGALGLGGSGLGGSGLGGPCSVAEVTSSLTEIAQHADQRGLSCTIDALQPDLVPSCLDVGLAVRDVVPSLGITLQAQLRRSEADLEAIMTPGCRVRLAKGAFEISQQTFATDHDADRAYVRLSRALLGSDAYPMFATHDRRIISIINQLSRLQDRDEQTHEFQMMYGVRPLEHRRLVDTGRRVRVSLPFGPRWYDFVTGSRHPLVMLLRQFLNRR